MTFLLPFTRLSIALSISTRRRYLKFQDLSFFKYSYFSSRSRFRNSSPTTTTQTTQTITTQQQQISSSDQLVLAAALLREHGGSLEPSVLKTRMRDIWTGNPGDAFPSGIAFVRQFPAVFSVEWGIRRLSGESATEFERYAKRIILNSNAPVQLLERATVTTAEPHVYGPLIEKELLKAGGYLSLRALTLRLQLAALEAGVRLPPAGVNWFILHPSPYYSKLRPVWSTKVQEDGYLFNEGCMYVENVVDFEAAELKKLASQIPS